MERRMTIHKINTTVHPNMVSNYKDAYKSEYGKPYPLNDLFIYAIIEHVGPCESSEEQDKTVLHIMAHLDWVD